MARQPLALSPNYLAVVRGVRELHRLTLAGRDESPDADAIRDAADGPWAALSEAERRRASGLSEDLFSISDMPAGEPREVNPQAEAGLVEAVTARERGEWDRALEFLRRWSKHLSPAPVSNVRGTIWFEAGDLETALLFCEHATQLDPLSGEYLAFYLHVLGLFDSAEARRRSAEILQNPDHYAPIAVAQAADIAFKSIRQASGSEAMSGFRQLVTVLEETLTRIEMEDGGGLDQSTYVLSAYLLGLCHELLGEIQAAVSCYSKGLQVDPNNDGLLVARGILLYGSSPRAITDFELAIRNGSSLVLPYFFLAHHYLVSGHFKDCLALCERASQMPASDAARSELAEWMAICQAELGFSAEMVRASFDNAIRLNPSNDRARRNSAAFEEAVRPPLTKRWETPPEAAVQATGLSERRYWQAA